MKLIKMTLVAAMMILGFSVSAHADYWGMDGDSYVQNNSSGWTIWRDGDDSYGGGSYTQQNLNFQGQTTAGAVHRADGVIEVYEAGDSSYGGGYSTQTNYVNNEVDTKTVFRSDGYQEVYGANGSQQNYHNGVLCYDSNNTDEFSGCN